MRNAKMPFVDEGHCITKSQLAFVSIHGGIPCNLAPAHFTVHVVQVRLNFALGKHRLNHYRISFLDFYTERGDIRRE